MWKYYSALQYIKNGVVKDCFCYCESEAKPWRSWKTHECSVAPSKCGQALMVIMSDTQCLCTLGVVPAFFPSY